MERHLDFIILKIVKMRKRISDHKKNIPVNELYTALQGEGGRTGMPTIVIRTLGCTLRCHFGAGGFCDAWSNSWKPEKSKYTFQDIIDLYDENPQIKEMMLTGGAPTMHPALCNELMYFAKERNIFVTMETEGSQYIETDHPIDLLSISPKFSNTIPKVGLDTPWGSTITQKDQDRHNKFRLNKEAIVKMINFHHSYQYKPVWDGSDKALQEIENFRIEMGIAKSQTYVMPAGDNRKTLIKIYPTVMDMCIKMGYNFTGRPHIIAFDTDRLV